VQYGREEWELMEALEIVSEGLEHNFMVKTDYFFNVM
jgi:hypothetical protein